MYTIARDYEMNRQESGGKAEKAKGRETLMVNSGVTLPGLAATRETDLWAY